MSFNRVLNNQFFQSDISGETPTITPLDKGREFYNTADNRRWTTKYVNGVLTLHEIRADAPMKIYIGQSLPTGAKPQRLLIDSGLSTQDITAGGNPLAFQAPAKYQFVGAWMWSKEEMTGVLILNKASYICTQLATLPAELTIFQPFVFNAFDIANNDLKGSMEGGMGLTAASQNQDGQFRMIAIFERFPDDDELPTSTVVSAVMDPTGYLIITFSDDMAASVVTKAEYTLTINGVEDAIDEITKDTESAIHLVPDTAIAAGDEVRLSIASGVVKNRWGGDIVPIDTVLIVNTVLPV